MIYILVHEYSDKSGFHICGATDDRNLAECWYNANNENNVYPTPNTTRVWPFMEGIKGWKSCFEAEKV